MPKIRTELAAIWPPTASARARLDTSRKVRSGDPRQVPRLLVLPDQRNPALRGRQMRVVAFPSR